MSTAFEPIAKPAPATVDQKSDFVLRPAAPAVETPVKPQIVTPQPIATATQPSTKPNSDFVPAIVDNTAKPAPVVVPESKPIPQELPKAAPVRDIVKSELPATLEPAKKPEPSDRASEFQPQPRMLTATNESNVSKPAATAPSTGAKTAEAPKQIVMTPRVIEPIKQPEMIINPTIKKDAVASSNKQQLTSLGQAITQGSPVTARPAITPARVTTIAKPTSTPKPTPITVEPVTENAASQLAPIVSAEQFSARNGSSSSQPTYSVRTALTPIEDDQPTTQTPSNGLGSFITTKPAPKEKQLPPIVTPEEHKQRAMRR